TIRNVPEPVDAALRQSARRQGKSLNEVAIDALTRGAGLTESHSKWRDLADIARTWRKDPEFDRAQAAQDTIDEDLWRGAAQADQNWARLGSQRRIALDTNRYTDLCRGDRVVVEVAELADEVWLPFIVVGELRAGFAVGTQGSRNEAILRRLLLKPGVAVLY